MGAGGEGHLKQAGDSLGFSQTLSHHTHKARKEQLPGRNTHQGDRAVSSLIHMSSDQPQGKAC